ncbi:hypothetical protein PWP93_14570 [Paraburkholderia sp. A1RI-2L]|uniref:hypothetical protein n=1 Tax=Paraburkholderia sp. A1RI-2L TaxID=3028367 RepID=UPI003B7DB2E0
MFWLCAPARIALILLAALGCSFASIIPAVRPGSSGQVDASAALRDDAVMPGTMGVPALRMAVLCYMMAPHIEARRHGGPSSIRIL